MSYLLVYAMATACVHNVDLHIPLSPLDPMVAVLLHRLAWTYLGRMSQSDLRNLTCEVEKDGITDGVLGDW